MCGHSKRDRLLCATDPGGLAPGEIVSRLTPTRVDTCGGVTAMSAGDKTRSAVARRVVTVALGYLFISVSHYRLAVAIPGVEVILCRARRGRFGPTRVVSATPARRRCRAAGSLSALWLSRPVGRSAGWPGRRGKHGNNRLRRGPAHPATGCSPGGRAHPSTPSIAPPTPRLIAN